MLTTYITGLKQAKAHRILQKHLSEVLRKEDLSMPEWALLGQVFDKQEGMRASELASVLDVEPPFATRLINQLEAKGLVERTEHKTNKKVKTICITEEGKTVVPRVENIIKERMQKLLHGLLLPHILVYMQVLETIISNDEKIMKGDKIT